MLPLYVFILCCIVTCGPCGAERPKEVPIFHSGTHQPVCKNLSLGTSFIKYIRSLYDTSNNTLRVVPIAPNPRCLHVFEHWVFTAPYQCPLTAGCQKTHHFEMRSGLKSLTVCDGNVPIDDRRAIEFRYIAFDDDYAFDDWQRFFRSHHWHMEGYYSFRDNFVAFLPYFCLHYKREPPPEEELSLFPGMKINEHASFFSLHIVPLEHKQRPRLLMRLFDHGSPIDGAPVYSHDAYSYGNNGEFLCLTPPDYESRCNVSFRSYREFVEFWKPYVPCESNETYLHAPMIEFSKGHVYVNTSFAMSTHVHCIHIKRSQRSFISALVSTVLALCVDLVVYLFPHLCDAVGEALSILGERLFSVEFLSSLFGFTILHASLYYYTANVYFHSILFVYYIFRQFN
nr:MAG: hypothetical protein [Dicrocoelium Nege-like virius]